MRLKSTQQFLDELRLVTEQLETARRDLTYARAKVVVSADLSELKDQVEDLKRERAGMLEEFDRKNRDLAHKIGLERKRQEFEVETAKREAVVAVREENLSADRNRFEETMKFQNEQFNLQVDYLKDLMGQVLERLPNVTVGGPTRVG